jgi:hypothetical protein
VRLTHHESLLVCQHHRQLRMLVQRQLREAWQAAASSQDPAGQHSAGFLPSQQRVQEKRQHPRLVGAPVESVGQAVGFGHARGHAIQVVDGLDVGELREILHEPSSHRCHVQDTGSAAPRIHESLR